jgi:hypothetical protein
MNSMTLGRYLKEKIIKTLLLIVVGLPIFWVSMYFLEIGGDIFPILILVSTIGIFVVYKYIHTNFIAHRVNKFEELPEEIPGLPNLRKEIYQMAEMKNLRLTNIFKANASLRKGKSYAEVIGFGKS